MALYFLIYFSPHADDNQQTGAYGAKDVHEFEHDMNIIRENSRGDGVYCKEGDRDGAEHAKLACQTVSKHDFTG